MLTRDHDFSHSLARTHQESFSLCYFLKNETTPFAGRALRSLRHFMTSRVTDRQPAVNQNHY